MLYQLSYTPAASPSVSLPSFENQGKSFDRRQVPHPACVPALGHPPCHMRPTFRGHPALNEERRTRPLSGHGPAALRSPDTEARFHRRMHLASFITSQVAIALRHGSLPNVVAETVATCWPVGDIRHR